MRLVQCTSRGHCTSADLWLSAHGVSTLCTMQKEKFNGPAPLQADAPLQEVLDGINVILDIFESRGFCTKVHTVADIQAWCVRKVSCPVGRTIVGIIELA